VWRPISHIPCTWNSYYCAIATGNQTTPPNHTPFTHYTSPPYRDMQVYWNVRETLVRNTRQKHQHAFNCHLGQEQTRYYERQYTCQHYLTSLQNLDLVSAIVNPSPHLDQVMWDNQNLREQTPVRCSLREKLENILRYNLTTETRTTPLLHMMERKTPL